MLRCFKAPSKFYLMAVMAVAMFGAHPVLANFDTDLGKPDITREKPPTLEEIENVTRENEVIGDSGMPLNIRIDALKEAAVSYGARAGLAARTYEIRLEIDKRARYLDQVYDFNRLLVPAPSGLLIEPPIVSEAINATLVDFDGQQAAVSDRIYNIINNHFDNKL